MLIYLKDASSLRNAYPAVKFITTGPTEAFMMYMKMSFFVGIFLVAPYILYQVWAFIAPGLYAHEKAYAVPFIVAGPLLVVAYNAELFGGVVHTDVGFAVAEQTQSRQSVFDRVGAGKPGQVQAMFLSAAMPKRRPRRRGPVSGS